MAENTLAESIKIDIKISDEVKISNSLDKLSERVCTLTDNFSSLQKLFKGEIGIKEFITDIGSLGNKMTTLEKGVVGATSVFTEFAQVKDGVYGLASGTESIINSLGDIAGSAAIASAALYASFGPGGLVTSIIVGFIGTIAGISEAFEEIDAHKFGEAIKDGLSNPGGISINDLAAEVISSIEEIGNSFSDISDKTEALETAQTDVHALVSEIENIKKAWDEGAISAGTATAQIVASCNQLADAIVVKLGAAGAVLLSVFAEGGIIAQAFKATGSNIEELRATTVQTVTELEQESYTLINGINELYQNDPENPLLAEKYQSLLELSQGIRAADDALTKLELTASRGLNWDTYLNDSGVDTTTLISTLDEVILACNKVRESAENDLSAALTSVQAFGNEDFVNSIKEGIPGALNYIDEQTALKALSITDTMQADLIGGIDEVIADAEQRWNEMSRSEQYFIGFESVDRYVQVAVLKYKTGYIDPVSKTIEEEYSQLGIDGAGWASEAADKIIDGLFSSYTDYTYDMMGEYVTRLNEDYKSVIDNVTEGIYEQMKERGSYSILGYDEGITGSISESEDATRAWINAVIRVIEECLDSHSPSKVMEQFGLYTTQGYNHGINENLKTSVDTMKLYMNSMLQPFTELPTKMYQLGLYIVSGFNNGIQDSSLETLSIVNAYLIKAIQIFSTLIGKMNFIGVNAMQGLLNGMKSLETSIYDKASEIANNIARTIGDALKIASPSRVMFELGVFTMEGFKVGMESMYDNTYRSLYEFSYNVAEPQILYPNYTMKYPLNNNTDVIWKGTGNDYESRSVNALLPYLMQIAQNTKESASKEFLLNIGDRDIAKANYRGQKSLGRKIIAEI